MDCSSLENLWRLVEKPFFNHFVNFSHFSLILPKCSGCKFGWLNICTQTPCIISSWSRDYSVESTVDVHLMRWWPVSDSLSERLWLRIALCVLPLYARLHIVATAGRSNLLDCVFRLVFYRLAYPTLAAFAHKCRGFVCLISILQANSLMLSSWRLQVAVGCAKHLKRLTCGD